MFKYFQKTIRLKSVVTYIYKSVIQTTIYKLKGLNQFSQHIHTHTFFDSFDMNIVFRSIPIIILSFANSNCTAADFSVPSIAAWMAAMFTRFARSSLNEQLKKTSFRRNLKGINTWINRKEGGSMHILNNTHLPHLILEFHKLLM